MGPPRSHSAAGYFQLVGVSAGRVQRAVLDFSEFFVKGGWREGGGHNARQELQRAGKSDRAGERNQPRSSAPLRFPAQLLRVAFRPDKAPSKSGERWGQEGTSCGPQRLFVPDAERPTPQVSSPSNHCSLPFPLFFFII